MADNGRPSIYSKALADEICHRMACGESLRHICEDPAMPARSTVMLWAATDRKEDGDEVGFSDRYANAVQARMMYHADELLDIADDGSNDWMQRTGKDGETSWHLNGEHVNRSRLRIDARKWLLSKLVPRYADQTKLDHTSSDGSMKPTSINVVGVAAESSDGE